MMMFDPRMFNQAAGALANGRQQMPAQAVPQVAPADGAAPAAAPLAVAPTGPATAGQATGGGMPANGGFVPPWLQALRGGNPLGQFLAARGQGGMPQQGGMHGGPFAGLLGGILGGRGMPQQQGGQQGGGWPQWGARGQQQGTAGRQTPPIVQRQSSFAAPGAGGGGGQGVGMTAPAAIGQVYSPPSTMDVSNMQQNNNAAANNSAGDDERSNRLRY